MLWEKYILYIIVRILYTMPGKALWCHGNEPRSLVVASYLSLS